jgi:hypothetical protein
VRFVVIDSPGPGPAPHWSAAFVEELAEHLRAAGAGVDRLSATRPVRVPLHRVAGRYSDLDAEKALTGLLRENRIDAVLHVGVGAGGSQNLLWLPPRLGFVSVGVVRAAEVLCHRGDLVDRDGAACVDFLDPERCARCCRSGPRRASAIELEGRLDLAIAGLQNCEVVWLAAEDGLDGLVAAGVPRRLLRTSPRDQLARAVAEGIALSTREA